MNGSPRLTIVLGPPRREADKRKLEAWSTTSGKSTDDIWIEYAHTFVTSLAETGASGSTGLDELLSVVLKTQVRTLPPQMTYMIEGDRKHPALVIDADTITGPAGRPLRIDFSNAQVRQVIGGIFANLLKPEWVRAFIAPEE